MEPAYDDSDCFAYAGYICPVISDEYISFVNWHPLFWEMNQTPLFSYSYDYFSFSSDPKANGKNDVFSKKVYKSSNF